MCDIPGSAVSNLDARPCRADAQHGVYIVDHDGSVRKRNGRPEVRLRHGAGAPASARKPQLVSDAATHSRQMGDEGTHTGQRGGGPRGLRRKSHYSVKSRRES